MEYADRTDLAVDVGFPFADPAGVAKAFGLASLPHSHGYAVIWTTTPWTLPSNQALNLHPDIDYALVDTVRDGEPTQLIVAAERVAALLLLARVLELDLAVGGGHDVHHRVAPVPQRLAEGQHRADVGALAARMLELAGDPALVARLGDAARRFAERLTWERAAAETEQHLQDIIAGSA